jgi:hypothetical protein
MITKGEFMDVILTTPQMVVEDCATFTDWTGERMLCPGKLTIII